MRRSAAVPSEGPYLQVAESVCESIPSAIIQVIALLGLISWSWGLCVAVALSWVATAYRSTEISFDADTNKV